MSKNCSGDITVNGQADSYWVEIGDVAGASKYCRSFYANITGNTTYAGMLNSLYTIDFGETDCDIALHISPADTSKVVWQLERDCQIGSGLCRGSKFARRQTLLKNVHELQRRHLH